MGLDARMDLRKIELDARPRLEAARREAAAAPGAPDTAIIEGPPTMNGEPHAGHVRGRVIKDMWYRYRTLRGERVVYAAGWDAQGLPVELQAQKELGIEGPKSRIEEGGIETLVAECKRIVREYHGRWVEVDRLLGVSADDSAAYWTSSDEYIEREWEVLRRARELGVLRDDHAVIAYCPGCQTSLSHAEVSQGYREATDPSLYYKARLRGDRASLVVWTTMPFTLVTDALVAVHPDEEYCRIEAGGEELIVGRTRLEALADEARLGEFRVVSTVRGSELEGAKYDHPLLDEVPELARLAGVEAYHTVVAEAFVDTGAGSGLVHISPANGEEDMAIARRRGVEVFCPIDDAVRFTGDAGRYAGMFVRDADAGVIESLRERGALVAARKIRHQYPHCWRSGDALVWMARRGWFYMLDRLGSMTVDAAAAVEYYYEQPRNRFLGIVSERHPWCISRERYWGTPLPVWDCASCGEKTWLHSRREIVEAAESLPDGEGFELHMPWIDRIRVRCSSCGGTETSRERYVLDTWHNSGAAPHSSLGAGERSRLLPAPFLTEGIDQTRGWAYTLLVEGVILAGAPSAPYSSFLFQGHVLDRDGNKMSKSKGNVVGARDLLGRQPADLVRLYFLWKSNPIEPINFDERELGTRPYQVLATLYNLHAYLAQNSSYDGVDVSEATGGGPPDGASAPDRWALSRLQRTVRAVTEGLDACRIHEAAHAIEDYVINDLSQAYVPMARADLWDESDGAAARRRASYLVMARALRTVDALLHPFCPHTTDHLHREAFGRPLEGSAWPVADAGLEDGGLEESFALAARLVSVASAARTRARLKRRWPIERVTLVVGRGQASLLDGVMSTLREQLNAERVDVLEADERATGAARAAELASLGLPVRPTLELDRKSAGPKARNLLPRLAEEVAAADAAAVAAELASGGTCSFRVDGREIRLDAGDIRVGVGATGENEAADRDGVAAVVPSRRSDEMVCRGLVRDLARRLQALRKERGHRPTDMLEYASVRGLSAAQESMVSGSLGELAFLVRVREATLSERSGAEYAEGDVDGQPVRIAVG